jgi:hypothetical protein
VLEAWAPEDAEQVQDPRQERRSAAVHSEYAEDSRRRSGHWWPTIHGGEGPGVPGGSPP